jgi:phage major head subunit gpT-like protein
MDITPSSVQGFFTGFSIRFSELYTRTPTFWQEIATLHPAGSELERIAWQGRIPTFREWYGPRKVHGVAAEGYSVTPKPWELTVAIDEFKLKDDTYGVYSTTAAQFGAQAKKLPDHQMITALKKGYSSTLGLCPDGLSFWNDSHPVDVYSSVYSTYDNNFPSTPLTPDNLKSTIASMQGRLGQDGKPLNVNPTELWVPPALWGQGKQILESDIIANAVINGSTQVGGQSNIWKNALKLRMIPELGNSSEDENNGDGDKTWYVFDTSKVVKPLLYVLREAAVITMRTSPTDPVVFDTHQYLYGGVERSMYGYALPFLASRCIG